MRDYITDLEFGKIVIDDEDCVDGFGMLYFQNSAGRLFPLGHSTMSMGAYGTSTGIFGRYIDGVADERANINAWLNEEYGDLIRGEAVNA